MTENPKYDDIIANYTNGNRMDFAGQVIEFGLIEFIDTTMRQDDYDPESAVKMIRTAVYLGAYK